MKSSADLFTRSPHNPIITAASLPYLANSVFNPAAAVVDGETVLLLRVEDRRGISHLTVARSKDGLTGWVIDGEPSLRSAPDRHPEELWGLEDPRVTWVPDEGQFVIAYTAYSRRGPLVSLATTTDFRTFRRLGPAMPPEDKDAALFPRRFDGRWLLIHRPSPLHGSANIWTSASPDMRHWGDHRLLLEAREGAWWDASKIGLGPPPLETSEGWLLMYHGVHGTAAGALYRSGLALLDLDDPSVVLRRSDDWLLSPTAPYERSGDVPDVVFPCGWVLDQNDDLIRVYYGASDTSVAVATASLSELLDYLLACPAPERRPQSTGS
jgi:predicted GH43/DUF377 family glycosyl hydrolase